MLKNIDAIFVFVYRLFGRIYGTSNDRLTTPLNYPKTTDYGVPLTTPLTALYPTFLIYAGTIIATGN